MRASRLLQLLLLLQNRGRLTSAQLAAELEVNRRTVLRDLDALTEAGLPVVVHRGAKGGVELGFNYRTRLTGLAADEAEALGIILSREVPALTDLGLEAAGQRARAKLLESLPDGVRETALRARSQFRFPPRRARQPDERVLALAKAVRASKKVRLRATSARPRLVHPVALVCGERGFSLIDAFDPETPIPLEACGDINISAMSFRERPGHDVPNARAEVVE